MNASEKVQVSSSLRRPETHFGHVHGRRGADFLTISCNIFQGTTIGVYEVEHQKTVNTNLENGLIIFQENWNLFNTTCKQIYAKRRKKHRS